jgi:hypothetical protein
MEDDWKIDTKWLSCLFQTRYSTKPTRNWPVKSIALVRLLMYGHCSHPKFDTAIRYCRVRAFYLPCLEFGLGADSILSSEAAFLEMSKDWIPGTEWEIHVVSKRHPHWSP